MLRSHTDYTIYWWHLAGNAVFSVKMRGGCHILHSRSDFENALGNWWRLRNYFTLSVETMLLLSPSLTKAQSQFAEVKLQYICVLSECQATHVRMVELAVWSDSSACATESSGHRPWIWEEHGLWLSSCALVQSDPKVQSSLHASDISCGRLSGHIMNQVGVLYGSCVCMGGWCAQTLWPHSRLWISWFLLAQRKGEIANSLAASNISFP